MANGYIYVFGGWVCHERYNIKKNKWKRIKDMSTGKSGISPVPNLDGTGFYILGGEKMPNIVGIEIEEYNIKKGKFSVCEIGLL